MYIWEEQVGIIYHWKTIGPYLFIFRDSGDWTQELKHARQAGKHPTSELCPQPWIFKHIQFCSYILSNSPPHHAFPDYQNISD